MYTLKAASAAALLVVVASASACGSNSSSGSAANADGPTDADKASFCATFAKLSDTTTPKDASDAFKKVGTPQDITSDARHGYEVLVEHLATMPDNAKSADFAAMQKSLSAADLKDVTSFVTYLTATCAPSSGSSSAPSAAPSSN
jgi:hypothetical protein